MGKTNDKTDEKLHKVDEKITAEAQSVNTGVTPKYFREGEWMIKPCNTYRAEYKDCKSLRGRFYQYFVDGQNHVCQQFNTDYKNCKKWKDTDDDEAYNALLASEKDRRAKRLKGNVENDVWTRRTQPPVDWNEPLPAWMQKRDEGTFLASKQKTINDKGFDDEFDLNIPSCVII